MAEIVADLPPLRRNPILDFKAPALPTLPRKRARQDDVISSDPPLFSSDDLPEAAENYASERPKRLRQRPWWGGGSIDQVPLESLSGPRKKKRELTRNFDSGVFMGSEGTEVSEEEQLGEPAILEGFSTAINQRAQENTATTIWNCLETGKETVDLSYSGLQSLPSPLLKPLQSMTKFIGQDCPPNQESFTPLTPSIRLFLHKNSLRSIPREIFNIERLTVLSLRHNELEFLPPAISRLLNLEELNLAGNRLPYLPWELLKLVQGSLKRINIYPNPFIEASVPYPEANNEEEIEVLAAGFFPGGFDLISNPGVDNANDRNDAAPPRRKWRPSRLGRGAVAFLTSTGQPLRDTSGGTMPSCILPQLAQPGQTNPTQPVDLQHATRVPSLIELALLRCSTSTNLGLLDNVLPPDTSPAVSQLLQIAQQVEASGGRVCSVCGRKFIVARAEWIEWWDCIPPFNLEKPSLEAKDIPPLLRQSCSWRCAVDEIGRVHVKIK